MIEFTVTEIILLAWAGIATAAALHYREEDRNHKRFVCTLIDDKNLRKEFYAKVDKYTEEQNAL